jgi:hypothetical protein
MRNSEQQAISCRPASHTHGRSLLPRHVLQTIIMVLLLAAGSLSVLHAAEPTQQPKALLDRIWPYQLRFQPLIRPLSKQDQEYAEAALIQWLESYLEPAYKVVDKRFFWTERNSAEWVAISKGHALYAENANGRWSDVEEMEHSWRVPGSGLVRLWRVTIDGKDHYFAISMTDQPVPGTRGRSLIGRFELKKRDEK